MSRFRHMALKVSSHHFTPQTSLGEEILSLEQTIPMVCWVRGGFGFFFATLPETFSSAGKNVGVLVWHFLGCLPGRLCSISHPARGEGEELAAGMGQGEEGWGVRRRRRRRVCHQPSSLPQSKGFHENLSLRLECQRKRHRRRRGNLFWFPQKRQRLAQSCWCRRRKHFYLEQFSMRLLFPFSNQNSSHQCSLCSPHFSQLCFLTCPLYSNLMLKHLPSLLPTGKAKVIFIPPKGAKHWKSQTKASFLLPCWLL